MEDLLLAHEKSVDMTADEEGWVYKPKIRIVSHKKENENVLANSNFMHDLMNCVQDGISMLDSNFNIIFVNAAMECWYNTSMPILGRKCYSAFHNRKSQCANCPADESIKNRTVSCKCECYVGGGKEIGKQKVYTVPITDDENNVHGIVEYVRDISYQQNILNNIDLIKDDLMIYENKNDSLVKIMQQREKEMAQSNESMKCNIEKIILPALQTLKRTCKDSASIGHFDFIEAMIKRLENPVETTNISNFINFTSREIEIATMVKDGKSSKEIAEKLFVSVKDVEFHRRNIRKKLGLVKNDKYNGNLRAYLVSTAVNLN